MIDRGRPLKGERFYYDDAIWFVFYGQRIIETVPNGGEGVLAGSHDVGVSGLREGGRGGVRGRETKCKFLKCEKL